MTVREYAQQIGMTTHAAAKRLQRAGLSSSLSQEVTENIKDILSSPGEGSLKGRKIKSYGKRHQDKKDVVVSEKETSQSLRDNVFKEDEKKVSRFSFEAILSSVADVFLVAGVVSHCYLVVQELIMSAGHIGLTAGVFVSLIYAASLVLSIMSRFYEQSFTLILVVFALDMCSIYLHYVSFKTMISAGFALGLAIIIGTCAFYCSYLFRSKHLVDDDNN